MTYEMKDNTGSLFKNERKETDNHPDYNGTAMVDGVEMWMSAWIKRPKSEGGKTYMSFSFKRKEAKPENAEANFRKEVDRNFGATIEDENIPF